MQENGNTKIKRVVPLSHHSRGKVKRECDLGGETGGSPKVLSEGLLKKYIFY